MAVSRPVKDVVADDSTSPVPTEAVAPVVVGVGDSPAAKYVNDKTRGEHFAAGYEPDESGKTTDK